MPKVSQLILALFLLLLVECISKSMNLRSSHHGESYDRPASRGMTIQGNGQGKKKYQICGFSRLRNLANFIPQWIEYHLAIGFDYFAVANDCSDDGGDAVYWLKFYERLGYVHLSETQPFNDCNNHFPDQYHLIVSIFPAVREQCEWITLFDIDEYVFPTTDILDPNPSNYLRQILAKQQYPAIYMQWQNTFHNGFEKRQPGLMIEHYTKGKFINVIKKPGVPYVYTGKHFARSDDLRIWFHVHTPTFTNPDYNHFPPNGTVLAVTDKCNVPATPIFLRHFYFVSYEDTIKGRANRTIDSGKENNANWHLKTREMWNHGFATNECPEVSPTYRANIAKVVNSNIKLRLENYYHSRGEKVPAYASFNFFNGFRL